MSDQITLVPDKRKYLFCTDQIGLELLQPVIEWVKELMLPYEIVIEGERDLFEWLSPQKMGTYLYVSLEWSKLRTVKSLAEEIGYSVEEAQYIGYGDHRINVFCCRCHGLTEVDLGAMEITCKHCRLLLEVSDHYSSLREAYLGYVAKL